MPTDVALKSYDAPEIHAPVPGPKASAIIDEARRTMSPSCHRPWPFVMARGQGVWVWDVDGNRFLDWFAGIAVSAAGHGHPAVLEAVNRQVAQFLHAGGSDTYDLPSAQLASALARLAPPPGPWRVLFTNSGTEGIEAAIKLARYHTGRPGIIAFSGAFHGRTYGALSLTSSTSAYRRGFGPLLPAVYHAPFDAAGPAFITDVLFQHIVAPSEIAAIVVEPIQGEGGYRMPPPELLPALRRIADAHGILVVADEVQSSLGRTGRMFAVDHYGVVPDIIVTSKGLAGGLPLGAVIAKSTVMSWPEGSHGSTFGGNPVACAAALAVLGLVEASLMANAARVGGAVLDQLRGIADRTKRLRDVRGAGLMIGVEITDADGRPNRADRDALLQACFQRGLLVLGAGPTTARICPALIISDREARIGLGLFEDAVRALGRSTPVRA